jgi:hypothetical protein
MYSRPLGTPAEEAELARERLSERYEKRRVALAKEQESTLDQRALKAARNEGKMVGDDGPQPPRPEGEAPAEPTMEHLVEKHRRRIEQADQRQLDALRHAFEQEIIKVDAMERGGTTQGLTGAQIAREAMNGVEPPLPASNSQRPRRDPTQEFNRDAEKTRGLDNDRIKIDHEARLDDPKARALRQVLAERSHERGPEGQHATPGQQVESEEMQRYKEAQDKAIALMIASKPKAHEDSKAPEGQESTPKTPTPDDSKTPGGTTPGRGGWEGHD